VQGSGSVRILSHAHTAAHRTWIEAAATPPTARTCLALLGHASSEEETVHVHCEDNGVVPSTVMGGMAPLAAATSSPPRRPGRTSAERLGPRACRAARDMTPGQLVNSLLTNCGFGPCCGHLAQVLDVDSRATRTSPAGRRCTARSRDCRARPRLDPAAPRGARSPRASTSPSRRPRTTSSKPRPRLAAYARACSCAKRWAGPRKARRKFGATRTGTAVREFRPAPRRDFRLG
jgi:hypothetical protein